MKKFKAFCKSFYKNVIVLRKFRAFALILLDPEYRTELNFLHKKLQGCTGAVLQEVSFGSIKAGHRLIYPEYSRRLAAQDPRVPIKPLKVVKVSESCYLVVDGNHRYHAIKLRSTTTQSTKVLCEVWS